MGRILLTALIVVGAIGTAVADLGFMHASNETWPPHARLHGIWGVTHVLATHTIALGLLWVGGLTVLKVRIAALILLAYMGSFFVTLVLAPSFGAAVAPDLAPANMPPTILGMDGNLASFLLGLPIVAFAWWRCERDLEAQS